MILFFDNTIREDGYGGTGKSFHLLIYQQLGLLFLAKDFTAVIMASSSVYSQLTGSSTTVVGAASASQRNDLMKTDLFEIKTNRGQGWIEGKKRGITDETLVNGLVPKWCALMDQVISASQKGTLFVLTITRLDLSGNKISDRGLRVICYDFLLRYGIKVEDIRFFRNNISNLTPLCEYVFRLGHPHTFWQPSAAERKLQESEAISIDEEDLPQRSADAVASLIANRDRTTANQTREPFGISEVHLSDNFLTVGIGIGDFSIRVDNSL